MILFDLAIFLVGVGIGIFSFYCIYIYPTAKQKFDQIVEMHKLINQLITKILISCHADRVLLFQVSNGEYFEGGTSMMKISCTNDRCNLQKPHLKQVRSKIGTVLFQHWADCIELVKEEGLVTLCESNQYEGFTTSLEALKDRGMGSGIYFKISKKIAFRTQMSAILCIEWEANNPPFTDEDCLKVIIDEYEQITKLVNNQIDVKIDFKKAKKIL